MTTRLAARSLRSAAIPSRAYSSALQYGHHFPRKKVRTRAPFAIKSCDRTGSPFVLFKTKCGIEAPTPGTPSMMPDDRKSSVARCMMACASSGIRDFELSRIFSSCSVSGFTNLLSLSTNLPKFSRARHMAFRVDSRPSEPLKIAHPTDKSSSAWRKSRMNFGALLRGHRMETGN